MRQPKIFTAEKSYNEIADDYQRELQGILKFIQDIIRTIFNYGQK